MPRWLHLTAKENAALEREVRASINGTLVPNDYPVIGRPQLLGEAYEAGLSTSQAYAAVNTIMCHSWMVGSLGTMASSAQNWLTVDRQELAARRRKEHSRWSEYGSRPPHPGNRRRGRPER